jgi:taurine dioxygenase
VGISIEPTRQRFGAVVTGVDPGAVDEATARKLHDAWHEHLVLFFPGINLTEEQHVAFAGVFGDIAATSQSAEADRRGIPTHPEHPEILVLENKAPSVWHTDVTFTPAPPAGSLLVMRDCPPRGGDTLWSSLYTAYEALSEPVKRLLDGLAAVHGRPPMTSTATHPDIKEHPVTGRKMLYVNRYWTDHIDGVSGDESRGLLDMLFNVMERPDHTIRWQWSPGDAALWDNHATMHYACNDYTGRRLVNRVTIYR